MNQFDQQLLRLKQALGLTADQDIAAALGMTKAALSVRKKRGVFPEDKVRALAGNHPEWRLDLDYIFTGTSDSRRDLNRRLEAIKAATEKVMRLGLPLQYRDTAQRVIFSVEIDDGSGVCSALDDFARAGQLLRVAEPQVTSMIDGKSGRAKRSRKKE